MSNLNFKHFIPCKLPCDGCQQMKLDMLNGVDYRWYRAIVPIKRWNEYHSRVGDTLLGINATEATIGFPSVIAPDGCLEITDDEELLKIDRHRRAVSHAPYVTKTL